MQIIDEEGDLFGRVNVIDALVLVLVLSVAVAGVALVTGTSNAPETGSDGGETGGEAMANETGESAVRYATVDFGAQSTAVANRIAAGDRALVDGDANATVTDVYVGPGADGGAAVTARVRLDGEVVENERGDPVFGYRGSRLRAGDDLRVPTEDYNVNGTVTALEESGESLETEETGAVLSSVVSSDVADAIEIGDEYRLAGETVATVESVEVYPTEDADQRRAVIGVTLATMTDDERTRFGDRSLALGDGLEIPLGDYAVTGSIRHLGNATLPGERTTTTAVVELEGVSPTVADATSVGLTESGRDGVRARVVERDVEPASVVLTSDDGDVHRRDHPSKKDVTLTVELATRSTETGTYFHGRELQAGRTIRLDFETVTVEGTVTSFEQQ
jgi:hypothetical protein